jgi:hypothetical protein
MYIEKEEAFEPISTDVVSSDDCTKQDPACFSDLSLTPPQFISPWEDPRVAIVDGY